MFDLTTFEIKNSKVLVVGGGDSASEYCQFLSEDIENNEVYLSYRKNEFSRMNNINKQSLQTLAENRKVNLLLNSNINSVTSKRINQLLILQKKIWEVLNLIILFML